MVAVPIFVGSATLFAVTVTVLDAEIDAGAVYRPVELIVPALVGVSVQVTAELPVLVTAAVNCWICPFVRDAVEGVTATPIGTYGFKPLFQVESSILTVRATSMMEPFIVL